MLFKEYDTLFLKIFFPQHVMMERLSLEEKNIIKDIRNLLRLKRELNYTAIKDIRNFFRLEKETKAIKDRIIGDIRNLFEHEEDYYKPVRVYHVWIKIYIKYKNKCNRKKTIN